MIGAFTASLFASETILAGTYGARLCNTQGYQCVRVQYGESWESMFPNSQTRDLVKRVNRMNIEPRPGMLVAVPNDAEYSSVMNYAPFNAQIPGSGNKTILVSPRELAWAAYSEDGRLVNWGPASLGKNFCPDVNRGCQTAAGSFSIERKGNAYAKSSKFPLPYGGAPMPYAMHFYKGYALHGGFLPGRNDSHGCVRLFVEDARWLNQEFAKQGTKVIVMPYGA